ncbi:MAG: hypothetical protein A2Z48_04420 [Actinobacteria bacterium RBG_19FT_COMBO_70_19]|jgi:uncharacterized membrane protein|nr:MAG: hypothetical protein A2Z48_04420 [Actinobacteria bacterium RBG_19FT_COMBO_70_19]
MRVARWVPPVTMALALGGLAVSIYLTIAHYTDPDLLVCSDSGTVNCSAVTTSAQSTFLGIPVALLGLVWFVAMLALSLPVAWNATSRNVHLVRFAAALGGIGFVLWLVYAELIIIGVICLWCTIAHVLAFGLFVVVVTTAPDLLSEE